MERRTRALYDAIFDHISRTFHTFINRTIITDYEAALVASLRASFPEASIKGCFFHFCQVRRNISFNVIKTLLLQALLRQAKALGIVRQIQGNVNGRKLLRKYYALALLPEAMIEEAFNSLQVCFIFTPYITFLFETHSYKSYILFRDTMENWTTYLGNSTTMSEGNGCSGRRQGISAYFGNDTGPTT